MAPKNTSHQRAPFSNDLQPLRELFLEVRPILEKDSSWYGSIYFERKNSKTYLYSLKQSQVQENVSLGAVLRIYDGVTLYEEATDDLDPTRIKMLAQNFAKRVARQSASPQIQKKFYQPPTWTERLNANLDDEIRSQIPKNPKAETPIHFGIRYSQDPLQNTAQQNLKHLESILEKCKSRVEHHGLQVSDINYLATRMSFSIEESLFIDRETNMSQTLYRLVLGLTAMSGPERSYVRAGGLGGLECIELKDSDINTVLTDLKLLKNADRLEPGQYRVLFGPAVTGVLAHEAFGHSQEGDTCARGRSKAWDLHQSQETVGNQHATILNNPAIFKNGPEDYGAWGSYFFDEEGWLAQEQILLDQGKLLSPMTNLTSAIRLGVPRTANGKRESWANGVYTRQTNTYFSAGEKTLEELMTELNHGFLALHPAGGMEDPKGMGIQVGLGFLYEVKNGKLTGKVFKGPAGGDIQMTGYTPDVLNSIIGKSKIEYQTKNPDRARHPLNDVGGCGKYHKEFVNAGSGGPYVLLEKVILG